MKVYWDPKKAKANVKKHGIHFSDAETVLYDPNALTVEDEESEGEQRHIAIGMDALGRVLVVVYTYRGDDVRVISARRASKKERGYYEEGI
jgi:uncharacterized DUF497 family protein